MSFLSLTNLSKMYGSNFAVKDLSLDVQKGEFVTLLGPSGCGKTTTLQMIAGFADVSNGTIHLDGRDITHVKPNDRGLGIVFQSYALFPHMTVHDNVSFGLEMRRVHKTERLERIKNALALVHLDAYADRYPRELSGGQRQRVALARALVIEPQILLLDEPLSNLDAKLREEMQFELRKIQRKVGTTTIMVTHDQSEAMSISDRIVVMQAGRIFVKAFKLLGDVLGNLWFWIVKLKDALYATFEYLNKYKVLTYALITALTIYAGVVISNALTATWAFIAGLGAQLISMAKGVTLVGLMTGALKLLKLAINGLLVGAIFLIIEDLAMWYTGNESLLQQLEETYPGALKALGMYVLALGIAMNTFGIRSALAWVLAMGPIGWIVAGIASVGAAIWYFWDDIVKFGAKFQAWGLGLGDNLVEALDSIATFIEDVFNTIVEYIQSAFDSAWSGLQDGFNGFLGFVASIGQQIAAVWDQYVMAPFRDSIALIMKAKDMITGALDGAKSIATSAVDGASNAASSGWDKAKSFLGFGGEDKNGVLGSAANPAQQTSNNNVNVNGVTVNVSTNNPAEMGNAVDGAIKNSLRNSQTSVAY